MNTSSQTAPKVSASIGKDLLTRKETAELLGINLSTLWSYTKTGKLKAYGLGNKVFYRYSEIMNESLRPLN
ncbi:MAG: helix-turn-helix domain-containing protein [Bacteroidetes bacterium]|nr:helix-turn-helix domain-containing protein [Bacteroidota bacterium]